MLIKNGEKKVAVIEFGVFVESHVANHLRRPLKRLKVRVAHRSTFNLDINQCP